MSGILISQIKAMQLIEKLKGGWRFTYPTAPRAVPTISARLEGVTQDFPKLELEQVRGHLIFLFLRDVIYTPPAVHDGPTTTSTCSHISNISLSIFEFFFLLLSIFLII